MAAHLRYLSGKLEGRTVDIMRSDFVIGRGDECDLRIDDDNVSREHVRIVRNGDRYELIDLGSTNGVRVNAKKVEKVALAEGDSIVISLVRLEFATGLAARAVESPAASASARAADPHPDRSESVNWRASVAVWAAVVACCTVVLVLILSRATGAEEEQASSASTGDTVVADPDSAPHADQAAAAFDGFSGSPRPNIESYPPPASTALPTRRSGAGRLLIVEGLDGDYPDSEGSREIELAAGYWTYAVAWTDDGDVEEPVATADRWGQAECIVQIPRLRARELLSVVGIAFEYRFDKSEIHEPTAYVVRCRLDAGPWAEAGLFAYEPDSEMPMFDHKQFDVRMQTDGAGEDMQLVIRVMRAGDGPLIAIEEPTVYAMITVIEPVVEAEKEELDYLWIDTLPTGATIAVNGVSKGITPVILGALTEGSHQIAFAMPGFEGMRVSADIPNNGDRQIYALQQKNGTCLVVTDPPSMSVHYGPQLLGITPLVIENFLPSAYKLRIVGLYYEPQEVSIEIEQHRPNAVVLEMEPAMGAIEIVTIPPGVKVYVDRSFKGTSRAPAFSQGRSEPMLLTGFKAGKRHKVHIEHKGETASQSVRVQAGDLSEVYLTVWYPDIRVTAPNGDMLTGMLLERADNGSIVVATTPIKHVRLVAAKIATEEMLGLGESQKVLRAYKQQKLIERKD